mmetsp:Transcript_11073/g.12565  ORF Transcript_11073/g.12565 Transcript_11073/m.12565 type:complete len:89 (-) Transcript_11073:215-481(-)
MTFKPKVIKFIEGKEFRWKGKVLVKGIFDGEHIFRIEENEEGQTLFHHEEIFTGVLASTLVYFKGGKMQQAFRNTNEAMKKRAESTNI